MVKLADYRGGSLLKCADLNGREHLAQVESIGAEEVGEERERKLVARFEGWPKGLALNNAHLEFLETAFGDDSSDAIGAQVVLFVDPDVRFGGKRVGGIRLKLPAKKKAAAQGKAAATSATADFLSDDLPEGLR